MLAADVQESTLGKKSEDSMWRREPWDLLITNTQSPKSLENDDCCITSISQISHIFLLGNSIPVQGKNSKKWCYTIGSWLKIHLT